VERKTICAAVIAVVGLTGLCLTTAQAGPYNWPYEPNRGYDEDRNYDEREYDARDAYDDEDEVVYQRDRRRLNRYERRRLRRWIARQNRRARNRQNRRRLYELWQREDGDRPQDIYQPRVFTPTPPRRTVAKPRPRIRLSHVPIPRAKPVRKTATINQPTATVKKVTLAPLPDNTFDERPALNARPAEKTQKVIARKKPADKTIEVSSLPKIFKPTVAKPATKKRPETASKPKRKPISIEVTSSKPERKRQRRAANSLSCKKARAVVAEFGFSDIITQTCTGKTYSFNAKRDSKPYQIKVSALSGELTDVRKLK
jgi:hypothetical protein